MSHPHNYKWTKEKCLEISQKYVSISDFYKNDIVVMEVIRKNNWMEEMCSHMKRLKKPKNYWTKEKCLIESLKYNSLTDFSSKSPSAYSKMKKNKWLSELNYEKKGNRYNRCIYSYEFDDKSVYIGLTHNMIERQMNRKRDNNDSVTKYINKTDLIPTIKQLTEYVNVNEAVKLEEFYLNKYRNDGWNILNVNKTGGIGGRSTKWTKEKCQEESIKYKHKIDFKKGSYSAYNTSVMKKWLDEICTHMIPKYKSKRYISI